MPGEVEAAAPAALFGSYSCATTRRSDRTQMRTARATAAAEAAASLRRRRPITNSYLHSTNMLSQLGLLKAAATSLLVSTLLLLTVAASGTAAGQTTNAVANNNNNGTTVPTTTTTSSSSTGHTFGFRVLYQSGTSEKDLPICSELSVCNKVDTYDSPWAERQCRCPKNKQCSTSLDPDDGFTITDKTRQFKLCEPVDHLPKCRYFRDVTWTFINYPDNLTQQIMHCACPKNSVAYIIKRQAYQTQQGIGYQYSFACSPQSRLRCLRKEPCRLFTVKKRPQVEEVNSNTLCQCPHGHRCPRHHLEAGVIPGKMYTEDLVRTYSGYCL